MIKPTGFAAMNVAGNAAVDSSTSAYAWNYWKAASFGPDSEAYVTVSNLGAADVIRIGARVTGGGGSSPSGYYVSVSAGAWSILRIDRAAHRSHSPPASPKHWPPATSWQSGSSAP